MDEEFNDPRLVRLYDLFEGRRHDLDSYLSLAKSLDAKSVLDIGCGTGCFADMLAAEGFAVTGVDPAHASLQVARQKPHAQAVNWIEGDTSCLPVMAVDLAFMTGNVAQVFLEDDAWHENLVAIRAALKPKGLLIFETRNPAYQAWRGWTREHTRVEVIDPELGAVACWCEVLGVEGSFVTFQWTYRFEETARELTSRSTIRFRPRDEIETSLRKAGYVVETVTEAPDRPGKEMVFVAAIA
ncbi:MAG: class I SAM-dependent methyltransferase [Alphaproteobacteria bacterium]